MPFLRPPGNGSGSCRSRSNFLRKRCDAAPDGESRSPLTIGVDQRGFFDSLTARVPGAVFDFRFVVRRGGPWSRGIKEAGFTGSNDGLENGPAEPRAR